MHMHRLVDGVLIGDSGRYGFALVDRVDPLGSEPSFVSTAIPCFRDHRPAKSNTYQLYANKGHFEREHWDSVNIRRCLHCRCCR